jgi:hypothetical protein
MRRAFPPAADIDRRRFAAALPGPPSPALLARADRVIE